MPETFSAVRASLAKKPRVWLVTGVAGFIGSNLLEMLLSLDQTVIGLDNFSTGHKRNLEDVHISVGDERWKRFHFHEGDIRNPEDCAAAMRMPGGRSADFVLHQAALGSVPRSIENPQLTNANNIDGFLNMLVAARDAGVKRFVYAASSSTYGDHEALPKVEDRIGKPLSPYAVTKLVNELYADVFARVYGTQTVGLRYFNIFGRRQDPNGAYAAVIPRWTLAMLEGKTVQINGDGETSRDFCYIDNALQANLLAALTDDPRAVDQVYNVAFGQRTTLNELFGMIRDELQRRGMDISGISAVHADFRPGDVRHSLANIDKAKRLLGYEPSHDIKAGLREAIGWYVENAARLAAQAASVANAG